MSLFIGIAIGMILTAGLIAFLFSNAAYYLWWVFRR